MTNNPPIAAWAPSTALDKLASRHNNSPCVLTDGPAEFNDVALIRLGDYERLQADHERLQAELELWKAKIDAMTEYKVAAHQLIGIPASVGISEPIEGFAKRPQDIMPAVRDMALRIEELERQAAERDWQLAESRANDQQAMAYLNQVRELVGGDDFPDMVRRCEKLRKDAELKHAALEREVEALRKDAERYRWLRSAPSGSEAQRIVNNTPEGMDATIDAAMEKENKE